MYKVLKGSIIYIGMSQPSYVCTVCSQEFTRKYSGQRHFSNIHSGGSEIVPYIEYMVEVQVGTWHVIHHGIASRENFNRLAVINLKVVFFQILEIRSGPKTYSMFLLPHHHIHSLLLFTNK